MTNERVFIDAIEGAKVAVFIGPGNQVGAATTPRMLAYILDTHKIFGEVIFCSTMDFADEVGFATHDGAHKIWDAAIAIRNQHNSAAWVDAYNRRPWRDE